MQPYIKDGQVYSNNDIKPEEFWSDNGVFPKWSRTAFEFRESDKSLKHSDSVSSMCLAGTVVASWSPTHEVAGRQAFLL